MSDRIEYEISIAGRQAGHRHPPLFWPDIDIYFRRDEKLALSLIDQLADAGCAFLKAAVLQRPDLCLPEAGDIEFYDHLAGKTVSRDYRSIIESHCVPLPAMRRLLVAARNRGMSIVLSVYDAEGLAFAIDEGAAAIKIPSSNITHHSLIKSAARTAPALVLDTGRSTFEEIDRAVAWAKASGAEGKLLVQHSPPGPPAPAREFRMGYLRRFTESYGCPVGLSDHHAGLDMAAVGVALGACVFEKGVVASKCEAGLDIAHALPVEAAGDALRKLHDAWESLGNAPRVESGGVDRMGCIAARALSAGTKLARDDISFAFPAKGVGAERIEDLIGAPLQTDLKAGEPISERDLAGDVSQ